MHILILFFLQQNQSDRIDELIKKLTDADSQTRENSTREIISMWKESALKKRLDEALQDAKNKKDRESQFRIEYILDRISIRVILGDKLVEHFKDKIDGLENNENTCIDLFESYVNVKGGELVKDVKLLAELTNSIAKTLKSFNNKRRFIEFISSHHWSKASESISFFLKDSQPSIQSMAIKALGVLEVKEYTKDIAGFLKASSAETRWSALEALGNLEAKEYADEIAPLLKDKNVTARINAVRALGQLGAKKHIKDIGKLLNDPNWVVKQNTVWSLGALGAKEFTKEIAEQLKDARVSTCAIWALGILGAKEYIKEIVELFDSEDLTLKGHVIVALADLGAKEYTKKIAELLEHKDTRFLAYVIFALGKLGAKDYAEKITKHVSFDELKEFSPRALDLKLYVPTKEVLKELSTRDTAKQVLKDWGIKVEPEKNE